MGLWEHIRIMLVVDMKKYGRGGLEEKYLNEYDEWLLKHKEEIRKTESDFVELILD